MGKLHKSILVISDTHYPANHPDSYAFLKKLKAAVRPTLVIHIGDEINAGSWSFHTPEVEQDGPDVELNKAIQGLSELYKLFPEVQVLHSNHGSLHLRKQKEGRIPSAFMKDYREALRAPQGWSWHDKVVARTCNGEPVTFLHGVSANALKGAMDLGCSLVQGHYHTRLEAMQAYSPLKGGIIYGMTVGCLVDDSRPEFRYNKAVAARPRIGCGVIINSTPRPVPMLLRKDGRWTGKLI